MSNEAEIIKRAEAVAVFFENSEKIHKAVKDIVELAKAQYAELEKQKEKPIIIDCNSFGDWIRRLKEENGYTVEGLAMKTGMSKYAISKFISAHKSPQLYSVERVAKAFGYQHEETDCS